MLLVKLAAEAEVRGSQDMAEECQDVFPKVPLQKTHGLPNRYPGEERHHIDTDHDILGADAERTQCVNKLRRVLYMVRRVANEGAQ
jgi:hypothetical protein